MFKTSKSTVRASQLLSQFSALRRQKGMATNGQSTGSFKIMPLPKRHGARPGKGESNNGGRDRSTSSSISAQTESHKKKTRNVNGPPLPRGQACCSCRRRKLCNGGQSSCRGTRCNYNPEQDDERGVGPSLHDSLASMTPSPAPAFFPQLAAFGIPHMQQLGAYRPSETSTSTPMQYVQQSNQMMQHSLPNGQASGLGLLQLHGPSSYTTEYARPELPPSLKRSFSSADVLSSQHTYADYPGVGLSIFSTGFKQNLPVMQTVVATGAAPPLRDMFISHFFSPTSIYHAKNAISELRYRTRLSFEPALQPNISLQHAVCLLGAASVVLEDSSRTQKLYGLAKTALEEELAGTRFPVDCILASHMLATWLWRQGRMAEGYMMNGRSLQLALICGLERIPSSTWLESFMFIEEPTGMPGSAAPASDSIELCERINIFHAIIATDLGASLTTHWPAMSTAVPTLTPLPLPIPATFTSIVPIDLPTPSLSGNINPSMFSGENCTLESASMLALHLLHRAGLLQTLPDEPLEISVNGSPRHGASMPSPESTAPNSPLSVLTDARPAAWSRTPRFRTQSSFRMLRNSFDMLGSSLAPHLSDLCDWDVAVLHIFLNAAKMALYDILGDHEDHDMAHRHAIACSGLINTLTYNIFRPGIFGPFTAIPWLMALKVLHAESKREERLNHGNEATVALTSARDILRALQARALSCRLSYELAVRGAHIMRG